MKPQVGDKVFITKYDDVEEVPITSLGLGMLYRVKSSVGGDTFVRYNEDMFLDKIKATEELIYKLTGGKPIKQPPKGKSHRLCEYCGSVLTKAEEKCGCKYGRR